MDSEGIELPDSDAPHPLDEPWLRQTFMLEAKPHAAMAFINIMGWYELYLNGTKVGDDVMSPAVTDYREPSLFRTYDLQPCLRKGTNCTTLWLSHGWNWPGRHGVQHDTPVARVHVDMIVTGKPARLGADSKWRIKSSGRHILGSWSWGKFGGKRVDAQRRPPDRVLKTIPAVACTNLGPGKFELDFRGDLTGWLSGLFHKYGDVRRSGFMKATT